MASDTPSATLIGAPLDEASPSPAEIVPGSVLFGVYEIERVLSSGGMGSVYRARHRSLGELRAIKVMRPEVAADPRGTELFMREARALLEVTHDAVTRCHDLLRDDGGRFYLITELVSGPSLRGLLEERTLSLGEVMRLSVRLAEALEYVHARGVVHRDLSPDNILLPDGKLDQAKIIDFGVARIADGATTAMGFKGKLAYASPEQLGLFGGKIDARSDLYSLGLVLAEAYIGDMQCGEPTILRAIDRRLAPITLPQSMPERLRTLLQALLMPVPASRVPSAANVLELLRTPEPEVRPRRMAMAILSALLGAALLLGAIHAARTDALPVASWLGLRD